MSIKNLIWSTALALGCSGLAIAADAKLQQVLDEQVQRGEIVGGIVQTGGVDGVDQLLLSGAADLAAKREIQADDLFWIASMTKPVTGVAVMMMQEQGKLRVDDPVEKYLPEFRQLKDAKGQHVIVTIAQCLTHSSGLADLASGEDAGFSSLEDLTKKVATKPLVFAPGSKWQYCQTGINTVARVVEVVSGMSFDAFLQEKIFAPLGMKDTTFYPTAEQAKRLAKSYRKGDQGKWEEVSLDRLFGKARPQQKRYPRANGGLFSTAHDYGIFAQMLLRRGEYNGKRFLKETSIEQMTTVQSGDLVTGFTPGNGWGLGCCVVKEPQGVSAALSKGSYGHGGAFGTQVWIDPVKKRYFLLLVQRADFPNSDGSSVRKDLQDAAWTKP